MELGYRNISEYQLSVIWQFNNIAFAVIEMVIRSNVITKNQTTSTLYTIHYEEYGQSW